ncbi:hypothetical protein CKO35_05685 [Ectothiorhodospira shaposhnikovii]|uniref:DUF2914 domain-containing protein n=1 Tax=Ectothiorhodospira shaposhnikovii TaxID=1054 RepID=UPI0019041617|nr:DUF2914 domain-containing protein [Ectothiorhodospira shaposhnikovii]MBK1672799.1 hypothetical protein [Ectothiorhodospira shaposhnikovii]
MKRQNHEDKGLPGLLLKPAALSLTLISMPLWAGESFQPSHFNPALLLAQAGLPDASGTEHELSPSIPEMEAPRNELRDQDPPGMDTTAPDRPAQPEAGSLPPEQTPPAFPEPTPAEPVHTPEAHPEPGLPEPTPPEAPAPTMDHVPEPATTPSMEPRPTPAVPDARSSVPGPRGHVARAQFTSEVRGREPIDQLSRLDHQTRQIQFFTEIMDHEGGEIIHRWWYGSQSMGDIRFQVGGPRWRVWSTKTLKPEWAGVWRVEVVTQDGEVLEERRFELTP